jgi:hypothetical protein
MDVEPSTLTTEVMTAPEFEGTLDKKKIKYRIVAFAAEGEGAVRKFGDESDWDVEDGKGFPAIPPAISPSRLPKLVCNTSVSGFGGVILQSPIFLSQRNCVTLSIFRS